MKQDKGDKIIQKAERKAQKAAQQVQAASKKAEAAKQKQAALAQKKAAKAADSATKKAAKKTKKAEAVAKKAQLAAKKAEEKKAKAIAKAAAKATGKKGDSAEGGEGEAAAKKKKSKKKLLMIAIPVLAVVIGAGAFFFLKGNKEEEEGPAEPIAAPAEYVLNEAKISALPVWGEVLVYQEEVLPEPPAEPENSESGGQEGEDGADEQNAEAAAESEEDGFTKILYRYEGLQDPGKLISAYMTLMTTADAGFSTVDETLLRIDPPEFEEDATSGTVLLARNVPAGEGTEAGVHSLLLSWEGSNCSVTLDMPEGQVHDPKPETAAAAPRRGLSDLRAIHPSKLGLPGESMDDYELLTQEGSVRIANSPCIRVNIYDGNSQIAGSFFVSSDGRLYKLDEATNGVVELDWE